MSRERKEIGKDGLYLPDGTYLKLGALYWDEDARIPVSTIINDMKPLGWATDLQREDDRITARIDWLIMFEEDDLSCLCTDIQKYTDPEDPFRVFVQSAKIQQILIVSNPATPERTEKEIEIPYYGD